MAIVPAFALLGDYTRLVGLHLSRNAGGPATPAVSRRQSSGRFGRVSPPGHGERDCPEREREADRRLGLLAADAGARWEGRAGIEEADGADYDPNPCWLCQSALEQGSLIGQKRPVSRRRSGQFGSGFNLRAGA